MDAGEISIQPISCEPRQQFDVRELGRPTCDDTLIAKVARVVERSGISVVSRRIQFGGEPQPLAISATAGYLVHISRKPSRLFHCNFRFRSEIVASARLRVDIEPHSHPNILVSRLRCESCSVSTLDPLPPCSWRFLLKISFSDDVRGHCDFLPIAKPDECR